MKRLRDIPAQIIELRLNVAMSMGAIRSDILKEANISEETLEDRKGRVSIEQAVSVWRSIVRQTACEEIGLICGLKARFQTMGILGYVMINSPTIAHAWSKFCNYQELVLSLLHQTVNDEGEFTRIEGILQEEWQDEFKYTIDYIYTSCVTLIKNGSPQNIQPVEVGFNFPQPANMVMYKEIYGPAKINFSCTNPYILYKTADLGNPVISSDESMYDHFELMLKEIADEHNRINENTRAVQQIILNRLKAELPKIGDVAKEIGMSVRSLQKRLNEEGSSFQISLDKVRKDIALKQLSQAQNNVTDVAFFTGFSDISSFSRNFKKWTGLTPTEYQNQH